MLGIFSCTHLNFSWYYLLIFISFPTKAIDHGFWFLHTTLLYVGN